MLRKDEFSPRAKGDLPSLTGVVGQNEGQIYACLEKTHRVLTSKKKKYIKKLIRFCLLIPTETPASAAFSRTFYVEPETRNLNEPFITARNKHGTALKSLQALSGHESRYLSLPICAHLCSRSYCQVCLPQPKNVMKVPKIDHTSSLHLASRQKMIIDSRIQYKLSFSVLQLDSPWLLDCTLLKYQPLNLFLA